MKRILVIEANISRCLALAQYLNELGFEVGVADNSQRAMAMLAEATPLPDFILLDIKLSSSNNWGLRDMLKQHKEYRQIPVILMNDRAAAPEVELAVDLPHAVVRSLFTRNSQLLE